MANDFGCNFVSHEMSRDLARQRRMLGLVTLEGDQSEAQLRDTVRTIFERFWNQPVDDVEVSAGVALFNEVKAAGQARLAAGDELDALQLQCRAVRDFDTDALLNGLDDRRAITTDPTYTLRAWSAVVTYALSDYNFLYE